MFMFMAQKKSVLAITCLYLCSCAAVKHHQSQLRYWSLYLDKYSPNARICATHCIKDASSEGLYRSEMAKDPRMHHWAEVMAEKML